MENIELQRCTRCVTPASFETVIFDEKGECSICKQHDIKHHVIDWDERRAEFAKIVDKFRGTGDYDCIVPISGGKDSTFVLYDMIKTYKVRPLAVSFDHGFYRPHHKINRDKVLDKLDVDFLLFRPSMKVVRKLMLESLIRKGDYCWHCHTGVFSWPMQVAIKYKIPLLIWGESTAEYTSYYDNYEDIQAQDEESFNRYINLGITAEDMEGFLGGAVSERELEPFRYPPLRELKKIGYQSLCYGSYHKWDVRKQVKIIQDELDWRFDEVEGIPEQHWYTKKECMANGVRDYLKFIKRGFGRTSQLTTDDIRAGVMTREEALSLIKKHDGRRPASLDLFLDFLGLTEDEFNEIAIQHVVKPWEFSIQDIEKMPRGKPLSDMNDWWIKEW